MCQRNLRTLRRALLIPLCLFAWSAHSEVASLQYEIIAHYPHPNAPFTQGLELDGDTVYESSGLYSRSYIETWSLQSQSILQKQSLPKSIFAEGLTIWHDRIYVLSWQEQRGFIFEKNTLLKISEFSYSGEGWGLTHNEQSLIMSDGSDTLRFLNPQTLRVEKTLPLRRDNLPITQINELEWIPAHNGSPARILANIWQTDEIVVINADNGQITAHIDLSHLYPKPERAIKVDVLNGIAWDANDQTILVTGKFWPSIYRIRIIDELP